MGSEGMSARFFLETGSAELAEAFGVEDRTGGFEPSYNIAPRTVVPTLWWAPEGSLSLVARRLGIVAIHRKATDGVKETAAIRAETMGRVAEFKHAFHAGRCAVPLHGHYEWQEVHDRGSSRRQPFAVARQDRALMLAAAVSDDTDGGRGDGINRVALLTLPGPERDDGRLPALLDPDALPAWLDRRPADLSALRRQLHVLPRADLRRWPVSVRVNDTRNDGPDLLDRIQGGGGCAGRTRHADHAETRKL
jgi:putative SOS response-associated peptidase YedK